MRLAAILLAAGAVGAWRLGQSPATATWQGYVDADFVRVGPTLQGLLTEVSVVRGQEVQAGAPLFAQDAVNDQGARDEAERIVTEVLGRVPVPG